ncbi:hypothetical protein BCR32DRAFT_327501 [Anaeromyces robustus]|uniref:Uncharacterized protein n=1 Tax=Anaeromyces robustus TaxID=1754192 RepID=A0A1Y1X587_9FUNG|nr:hypothetical protein BCR32DRAFT_327501 [Anaeromyces robustus]|eukprot:ORX80980.1 hypothetical protein BCR32DRAFT_327501 [Anaeromyces robustus]
MISFEDLEIYYEDEDIKAFYDEYNNNCNPIKLLEIAKRGILLYEPLNSLRLVHPYLVDISVLAHQNYIITNIDQYNRFKTLFLSGQYQDEFNHSLVFNLLIINKTFIDFYINDNEFIGYLMENESNDRFVNYNYVRVIHKLVEYGYVEEKIVKKFFSKDLQINSSLTGENALFSSLNGELDSFMNIIDRSNDVNEVFSSYEKENIENCEEILQLHNYFYLNDRIQEYQNILNECSLGNCENLENLVEKEEYNNIINLLLSNEGDLNQMDFIIGENQYQLDVLNKNKRNSLLLENINDINLIYLFKNNPGLFNKFDIHDSFEKFPMNFPIKIIQKYSNIFVNYTNHIHFESENQYLSELMNNCKNDEYIELLNNLGFINPDVLNSMSLYHKKYVNNYNMESFMNFKNDSVIDNELENSYYSNISIGTPFLS